MGTNRSDIYHQLKFNLYQDDAVTGEAAALGMGLVMFGSKSYITVHDMIMVRRKDIIFIYVVKYLLKLLLIIIPCCLW